MYRFRDVRLATLRRDRQRREADGAGPLQEGLEFLERRPDPRDGPRFPGLAHTLGVTASLMLSYLTTSVKDMRFLEGKAFVPLGRIHFTRTALYSRPSGAFAEPPSGVSAHAVDDRFRVMRNLNPVLR